ncbi:type 1 periplasmic-binding domain-containing protein, partial [Streptomyces sparsus]
DTLTADGGPLRAAAVRVTAEQGAEAGVSAWLDENPKVPDRQGPTGSPRTAAVLQSVAVLVALGLLYTGLGTAGVPLPPFAEGDRPCPEQQFEARDRHGCLGLSDGTRPFRGMAPQYKPLLAMIARNNADVAVLAAQGHEVRTVVLLEPFTAGSSFSELVEGGVLPELRGVALQQRELIEEARNNNRKVGVRVLLGNAGPLFEEAERVAERIRDRMAAERIVGVIGLGQSRPGTVRAIEVLDRASLPMVGTSATADQMIEQSPQYYQIAPINRREAQAAVSFVRHEESVTLPDGSRSKAKSVVVVNDPADPYSKNLSEDFVEEFQQAIGDSVSVLGYSPEGDKQPVSANDLALQVCNSMAKEPATMVFWAARAREMLAFLDEFGKVPSCGGKITVLGGDDLTNSLIQEENPVARYPGLTLHHMAHAVPGIDRPTLEVETFVARYQEEFGKDDIMLNDGHPALGWDALKVLAHAVNLARGTSNNPGFDRATVSSKLRSVDNSVQGSTGVLNFTREQRPVPVPVDKPIYVIRDEVSGPVIALKCGNFGAGQYRKKWGGSKAHRCPSD